MSHTVRARISGTTILMALIAALGAPGVPASESANRDADKLMIVDCMLPGKIMKLGAGARYMSARRPIKTTGADCEIRGGEYVAYDRASYATSLAVWLPEAKAGDPKAQTYVGEMFEQGLGTTPDYQAAVTWYRKAAEQGYERAQMNLGSMYERGLGVPQDELLALNWYRKATGLDQDELVYSSELAALETESAKLREALAASEAEVARLRKNLDDSRKQLGDSQASLDRSRAELESLRFRAERARSIGDAADVAALTEQIQRKEEQLRDSQQEIMDLRIAFDRQQEQLTASLAARQDEASTGQLLAMEQERIRDLERQVQTLTGALEERQADLRRNEVQLDALRSQLAEQAGPETAESSELGEIVSSLQGELEERTLEVSYLARELENQRQLLAEERVAFDRREQEWKGMADVREAERRQLHEQLENAQSQLASFQQQLLESDRLIDQQRAELAAREKEYEAAKAGDGNLAAEELRGLENQLGDRSIELAGTQGENAALRAEIAAMKDEMDRLRDRLAAADASQLAMRGVDPNPGWQSRPSVVPDVQFGRYYALLIGNNNYAEFPALATPGNDARAIARILEEKYGFKTEVLIDADRYTILQTLNNYRERLTENDNFLLYYAGHGTLDEKNNRGHWLPVDASPGSPVNWISNVTITDYINTMAAKHIMVIADSCYSGTLTRQVRTHMKPGSSRQMEQDYYRQLARIPSRTALTSGGTQPVLDGGGGDRHSIFARSLMRALESNQGILQGPDLFLDVHDGVRSSGLNEIGQVPTFDVIRNTGDLGAPFFFVAS